MDLCISVPTYQKAVQTQQLQQDDRKNTASWKCCGHFSKDANMITGNYTLER
jgi:hypothetical protein